MKKKQFTEVQIAFALRQAESGTPVAEIIRKMEISEVTFYRYRRPGSKRARLLPAPQVGGRIFHRTCDHGPLLVRRQ